MAKTPEIIPVPAVGRKQQKEKLLLKKNAEKSPSEMRGFLHCRNFVYLNDNFKNKSYEIKHV